LADLSDGVQGYVCIPYKKGPSVLIDYWKKSYNITEIYFVTATFSNESLLYFYNGANHYILASFRDLPIVLEDIKKENTDRLTLMFSLTGSLFERATDKLNYISMYFTKYTYGDPEISDLANVIAKRERVKKARLTDMLVLTAENLKFVFPYSKNVLVLELEGEKTHRSDQKYCERTTREGARKGILLSNLVSFSILEKLR